MKVFKKSMKRISLYFIFLISFQLQSQIEYSIKLKDELELKKMSKLKLYKRHKGFEILQMNDQKIPAENISQITYKINKDSILNFIPLEVRYNFGFKKRIKLIRGLGYKVYENCDLELYHAVFGKEQNIFNLDYHKYRSGQEIFIKKKSENIAYGIGFVDGYGWENIKKRVLEYFEDCPNLKSIIKKNKIKYSNTLEIVKLYCKHCHKNN